MQEYKSEYRNSWYHTTSSIDIHGGIQLRHIGHNLAKPNYISEPRQHSYYSFHFVKEGYAQLNYEDQQIILSKGDLFCKFPNTTYQYHIANPEHQLKMIWIALEGEQIPHLLSLTPLTDNQPFIKNGIDQDLDIILQQLLQLAHRLSEQKYLLRAYSLLYSLFSQLVPYKQPQKNHTSTPTDWIRKSMDFIDLHYCEPINVDEVCKQIGVHRTHFSKIFSKAIGISPSAYLQKKRLEKASHLLQHSQLAVTEIAISVGYADLYTFTRAFSRYMGMSPSEYRKKKKPLG